MAFQIAFDASNPRSKAFTKKQKSLEIHDELFYYSRLFAVETGSVYLLLASLLNVKLLPKFVSKSEFQSFFEQSFFCKKGL